MAEDNTQRTNIQSSPGVVGSIGLNIATVPHSMPSSMDMPSMTSGTGGCPPTSQTQQSTTINSMGAAQPVQPTILEQVQQSGNPLDNRKIIWKGQLEWKDKMLGLPVAISSYHRLDCMVSIQQTDQDINCRTWPSTLIMQPMPQIFLSDEPLYSLLKGSRQMMFHFETTNLDGLRNLYKLMAKGFAGCVHIPPGTADVRLVILLFSPRRNSFVGLLASNQNGVVNGIREIIIRHKQKQERLLDPHDAFLFNQALVDGEERDRFVRINVVGYFAQGKTSLVKRLLNQSIDGIASTDGIDVQIRKCKFKETLWELYETKHDEDCCRRLAIVAKSKDVKTIHTNEISTVTLPEEGNVHVMETENKGENSEKEINQMNMTQSQEIRDCLQGREKSLTVYKQDSSADGSSTSEMTVSRVVKNLLLSRPLRDVNVKDVAVSEDCFYANIWDFGGQYIYYATHQIFHSRDAIYLLVFDLRQDLESFVIDSDFPQRRQKIKNCLKFWINSVDTFVGTNDGKQPVIILVGTHKDKFDGDIDEKFGKVIDLFVGTKAGNHIYETPFAVSNVDTTDESICELRKAIFEIAEKHYVDRSVPAKWIPLEIALLSTREEKNILTIQYVMELANRNMLSTQDEGDIKLFLKYHHEKGTVIYFDEEALDKYVIVDPRYLIDAFKCIFTSKDVCKWKNRDLHPLWKTLETTAVLERDLVNEVWKYDQSRHFIDNADILLMFLQRHRIISELLLFDNTTETVNGLGKYLVPSMLRQQCDEEHLKAFIGRKRGSVMSLGFKLEHNSVLENIYMRITAAALGQWPPIKYNGENFLFKNTGFYRLDRRHVGQIALKDERGLELAVYNLCVPNEVEITVCDRFRRYIENVILYDFKRLHGDLNTKPYEYYFTCNHKEHGGYGSKEVLSQEDMDSRIPVGCPDYLDHSVAAGLAKAEWFLNETIAKDQIIPDRRVTDKDLIRIAESLGKNWTLLGVKLGFSVDEIERMEMDYAMTGVATTIFYMLYQWKERNADRDTFNVLIKAMKECKQLSVNWDKIRNIVDDF